MGDSGESEDLDSSTTSLNSTNIKQIFTLSNGDRMSLKTFYYLISTMNNMFPDYDFSEIPVDAFKRINQLASLRNHFNTSIFNTGIDRNTTSFADFTRKMWDCMDEAVGVMVFARSNRFAALSASLSSLNNSKGSQKCFFAVE